MKYTLVFILLIISSCSTLSKKEPVPRKVEEKLNITANKIIPKAKKCFQIEYKDKQGIHKKVDVSFDIYNDGKVLVTKISSKSELSRTFKKCIELVYETSEFSDPIIKEGKKIKFIQSLEFTTTVN
ncbi:hypothetical protein [Halobacteriovorax sp. HLS]|uniref:hypothetical protein n=1 Tax=Halobacteriovorax sp. HLS TaxID=2234000 RepID=UPI000FDB109D|nr:hypothetical protein [Halobacteriovorax sp. HLS]